ncbi:hypothetical protein [Streptomyces sp. TR02-1]|uniref:hypothetical protein n=1 Tax=Streptomyces sp. TR02-1 TaxID=3385977 RepID=UPI0039A16901
MLRMPAPLAVVRSWINGPNSEAGAFFSEAARYHYPRDVADWLSFSGDLLWQPTPMTLQNWVIGYRTSPRSRDRATAAVRSFYRYAERHRLCRHCGHGYGTTTPEGEAGISPGRAECAHPHSITLVPHGTYAELRQNHHRFSDGRPGRDYLEPGQARALMLAAASFAGQYAERTRVIVYLLLSNLRPGQVTAMRLEGRRDEQHRVTWAVPQKNASRNATVRQEIPREAVLAIDAYLPVRAVRPPHSYPESGPLLTSRYGKPLDRMNSVLRGLRAVAVTHPDLRHLAPELSADAVAHSPSPFE